MREDAGPWLAGQSQQPEVADAMVRVDALRRVDELVSEWGGDLASLCHRSQIDPNVLCNRHAMFALRALANFFDRAAQDLGCPDFACRLAELQRGAGVFGPLDIAMRNAATPRQALEVLERCIRAYSPGIGCALAEPAAADGPPVVRCVAHLPGDAGSEAVRLHTLLTIAWVLRDIAGGNAIVSAQLPDALVLEPALLDHPVEGADPLIHDMAVNFIETRYPMQVDVLGARVRANMARLLAEGRSSAADAASTLGMHTRTLQRRLRAEGASFEIIRESARKELAWRYLRQGNLPLVHIARLLGFSESSVLSRNCFRWFGLSPRQVREESQTG